ARTRRWARPVGTDRSARFTAMNASETPPHRTTEPDAPASPAASSRHLDVVIDRPWREVYAFASDPRNLPRWAGGLAGSEVQREVSQWSMNSPMGRVLVSFVPENVHGDRKSTRLNSSHVSISYAVFCLKKKNNHNDSRIYISLHSINQTLTIKDSHVTNRSFYIE